MATPIYLDNAATTPLSPEVQAAMEPCLRDGFGNPSSRHGLGVRAAEARDGARRVIARALGAGDGAVVFTSGGTEANNLAVQGFARARRARGRHLLVGPTEHSSVRESALALAGEGFEVEFLRLTEGGELDLEHLEGALRPDTVVVAQMLVNSELGTVYPLGRVARLVRRSAPHAALHVDAVQAVGKVEVALIELGIDALALSAHKIHGPKGVGALVLAPGVDPPQPLLFGGGQERGLRSGTENVAGAVGLGRAVEIATGELEAATRNMGAARARLAERLAAVEGVRPLEAGRERAPSVLAVLLPGPPAEVWLHHLEREGVLTSVGSACQANRGGISNTLLALGLGEEEARRVLRFSFSPATTLDEVEAAAERLTRVAAELGAGAR